MIHRIGRRLIHFLKCAVASVGRVDARTARWADRVFPEKRIRRNGAQLSVCAVQIEKCFLGISAALEGLAGRSSRLVEGSGRLLKYSEGRDDERFVFQDAFHVIERPLDFNDECLRITARAEKSLTSVAARISRLGRFQAQLEDSLKPLRILEIMFRIESASAPREILRLFVALSEEIAQLMDQMAVLIGKELESIESAAAILPEIVKRVGVLRVRQLSTQRRRAEIQSSMDALARQIEEDKLRDARLVGASEAIVGKVAGMVEDLQYQDILNQRLQHIIEGVDELAGQAVGLRGKSGDALCFLRDGSRVESAQIEGVAEALSGAMERLGSSLDGLAEAVRGVGREGANGGAADRMVQVLCETIRENTALVESTGRETDEILTALEPIGGLLGNLTGSILSLSARMRLISLNAQIQAAQAGDGTGLEILACRAGTIAQGIVVQVAELARELQDLKQILNTDVEEITSTQVRSVEFLRLLHEDGGQQETCLRKFQETMHAQRGAVSSLIGEIQKESEALAASLSVRSTLLQTLDASREEFQGFAEALAGRLRHKAGRSRVEDLARVYTAATERSAHDRAMAGPAAVTVQHVAALAEGSIELF